MEKFVKNIVEKIFGGKIFWGKIFLGKNFFWEKILGRTNFLSTKFFGRGGDKPGLCVSLSAAVAGTAEDLADFARFFSYLRRFEGGKKAP